MSRKQSKSCRFTTASAVISLMPHGDACTGMQLWFNQEASGTDIVGHNILSRLCGHVMGRQGSILASLSTSLQAARVQQDDAKSSGWPKSVAVRRYVDTLLGLPRQYLEQQAAAQHIYHFHKETNGFFPRPCPQCSSGEFFVPCSSSSSSAEATSSPSQASQQPSPGPNIPAVPVAFDSRPLVCQQCQRWFHQGCMGMR